MNNKVIKNIVILIAIIVLLIIATSCTNTSITGFAVKDDVGKGKNNENTTNATTAESTIQTINQTTADEITISNATTAEEKEKKEKETKEEKPKPETPEQKGPNVPPVWKSDVEEFVIYGKTTIDLNNYFYDDNNDTITYTSTAPEKISAAIENNLVILTPDGNNFTATIEFTATDGDKTTRKEVTLIVPERSIAINLRYKPSAYDIDENGYEPIEGIIDFTVENSKFSWDVNETNLCTRWEVYSVEDVKSTTVCYGSEKCCAFIGLGPSKDEWSEVFYSTYGQYGATLNNVISSQIIYVDYGVRETKPYVEIYYSQWQNLSANYYFSSIDFENVCVETCILKGFNETGYKLIFEIDNAVLELNTLTYSIVEEISNVLIDLAVKDDEGLTSGSYSLYKDNVPVAVVENFVEPDYYDIEVVPKDGIKGAVIDKLLIENTNITKPLTATIGIDNVTREISIENVEVKKRYAVDLEELEFDKATLTATATASSLFKCKQWDYDSEVCFGSWEKIKDLAAWQQYELALTANDPGFIEGNSNITIAPINITNITGLALIQNIPNITITINKNATIGLTEYFANVDEGTVFSYFEQDNISIVFENGIATVTPPQDFIGTSYTYITATKGADAAISNVFSIIVTNATAFDVTPTIILEKKDFMLDEDVELDFEYFTKQELTEHNEWRDEYEVYEEETEKTEQELESLKQRITKKEKQFKKHIKENETIETFVIDADGNEKDINVEIEELREGKFDIKIPNPRAFKAGKYTIKLELIKDGITYSQQQDFTWGVLAINVNKSIYLPNEHSFIGIAVLDDKGKIVCNADVTLEITNPLNQKTTLTTSNGDIKISPECQVLGVTELPDYYTTYAVNGVGNYIMNLTAATANGVRSVQDNFTVQSSVDFDAARHSATRIYPPAAYAMNISIIANKNYNGIINEYVPSSFDISEVEFYEVSESSEITLSAVEDAGIYNKKEESGRAINTTGNHPYLVKSSLLEIRDDLKLPPPLSSIKNPSKSSGLDLSLSKIEKDSNKDFGLSCGILNKTTENIFSFGNFEESVKCQSLVINTLCSDLENAANLPLESPFGLDIVSNPRCVRNTSNLFFTFSSLRNLTEWDGELDIVSAPREICCILKGCQDMLFSDSWMVLKDFFSAHSSMEHLKDLPDHDSCALESRSSTADFAVPDNVFVDFDSHIANNEKGIFKGCGNNIHEDSTTKLENLNEKEAHKKPNNENPITKKSINEINNNNQNPIENIANFFTLLPSAQAQANTLPIITTINDTKIISIDANLKKGKKYILSYKFDAPDISPEFYVLGPLEIGAFREARNWQIASDAVFVDDTDTSWNLGTFDRMYVRGTGSTANLTGENQSGHFASQIFDSVNTNANWTNISIVTESHYGIEIGRAGIDTAQGSDYLHDWNNSALPYVNTSGLVFLMHFNNESNLGESTETTSAGNNYTIDFSVDVNPERIGQARNNGTFLNGATINKTDYVFGGGAGSFDGSNDLVEVANNPSLQIASALTISAWVRRDVLDSAFREIVRKDARYFLLINNQNEFALGINDDAATYNSGYLLSGTGQWEHLLAVYNDAADTIVLYYNGINVTNVITTQSLTTGTNALRVGAADSNIQFFDGLIDEVTIWNLSLIHI